MRAANTLFEKPSSSAVALMQANCIPFAAAVSKLTEQQWKSESMPSARCASARSVPKHSANGAATIVNHWRVGRWIDLLTPYSYSFAWLLPSLVERELVDSN